MFFSASGLRGFGNSPCLITRNGAITYADLAEAADRFASRWPARRGLVAIEMLPNPTTIAAYLGALQAGHAVMPLPAGQPDIARKLEGRFRPAASWRTTGERSRLIFHENPAQVHDDLALLLSTSGSTGEGRGVRLSISAVEANARSIAEYLRIGSEDRAALVLPLHYSYGLSVLHSHLACGASVWLDTGSVAAPGFLAGLEASGATSLAGVSHHFRLLAGAAENLPACLSCLTVAGGAMPPSEVRHWAGIMAARQGRFMVMYGQTEATARIAYLPPEHAATSPDAIGRAIPGGSLLLRDDGGRTIDCPGAEGELVYRGPNVMMGYAETAADLARGPELAQLATGDLARLGPDGFYRITGRLSRMSKIAGLRIGHDALERALADAGHHVAVWGNDDTIWIAAPQPSDALAAMAARLAGVGAQHVVTVPCREFPRHPNSKVDYPALRRLARPPARSADLIQVFGRTFGRPVQPTDSFASLGGDSLQHVELSLMIDQRLGGLPAGWEQMPVAQLMRAPGAGKSRIPMDVLARGLAILAVVTAHQTNWPVYGGAAAMMILLGMSVAQHRRHALVQGDALGFLRPALRVLLPYFLVLAGYALAWQQVPWVSVALMGNLALTAPETHLMLPYLYWFVEAYMQISLLVLLMFWPGRMRQWLVSSPFGMGLVMLALAMLMRVTLPEFWPLPSGRSQFSVPWVFYLFAFGWCIAVATTRSQRALVLLAAALAMPLVAFLGGNWFGGWIKYMSLLALIVVLLHVRTVSMPRPLVRGFMHLAQAAFPIYLLHRLVPEVLMPMLDLSLSRPVTDGMAVLGGIALGVLAGRGLSWLSQLTVGRVSRTRLPDAAEPDRAGALKAA
nr:AMP-binding protein [Paracoccus saliphilus]